MTNSRAGRPPRWFPQRIQHRLGPPFNPLVDIFAAVRRFVLGREVLQSLGDIIAEFLVGNASRLRMADQTDQGRPRRASFASSTARLESRSSIRSGTASGRATARLPLAASEAFSSPRTNTAL